MISLAFFGPIPWIYCNAITTRLLVGYIDTGDAGHGLSLLLPAQQRRPAFWFQSAESANDNATPSPFPGARYRLTSPTGCGLINGFNVVSSTSAGVCLCAGEPCGWARPGRSVCGDLPLLFEGFAPCFRPAALASCALPLPALRQRICAPPWTLAWTPASLRSWLPIAWLRMSWPETSCSVPWAAARLCGLVALPASSARLSLERPIDRTRHLRGSAPCRRPTAATPCQPVVVDQRRGLVAIGLEPPPQHLRIVVGAQRLAARRRLARSASRCARAGCPRRP